MQDKQNNQSKIEQLQKIIDESSSIVFFVVAGHVPVLSCVASTTICPSAVDGGSSRPWL